MVPLSIAVKLFIFVCGDPLYVSENVQESTHGGILFNDVSDLGLQLY